MHWGIVSSYELGNTYIILFHKMSSIICRENVDLRPPEKSLDEQVMGKSLLLTKLVVSIMLVAIVFLAFFSIDTPLTQATFGSSDILFEYGAESGTLQPPLDVAGPEGSGSRSGSYAQIDDTFARTGDNSLKLYQISPTKSDAQRRVEVREYQSTAKEFYLSWWVYFDDRWSTADTDGWGTTLGGWQIFFGESGNKWHWWTGGRFFVSQTQRNVWFSYAWHFQSSYQSAWADAIAHAEVVKTSYSVKDSYLNQWVHFQVYIKFATDNSGAVKAWFNDNLVMDKSGFPTNPEGYSAWNQYNSEWAVNDYPWIVLELYQDTDSFESWYWIDDVVMATEKVLESYGVGYVSLLFESWENGFEEGDFSTWNGTQYANGGVQPSVTSTYAWNSTYSGNFTTDGSLNSYARAMHMIQDTTEIYQRSYIRFEDLPDTDGTTIWVLRVAQEDGAWIASAGVNRTAGNYYWRIGEKGGATNNTLDEINAYEWYEVEFYFNATTNGQARLWVNGTLMCEMTGDFSGVGNIARVYPYIYISGGAQASAKTVYHDNYRVDNVRMDDRANTRIASRVDVTAEPNAVLRSYGLSQITVQLKDQDNQTVAQSGVTVTVEISSWSGPSPMKPVLFLAGQFDHLVIVTTDSDGLATIYFMAQGAAGTATLTASADGLSSGNIVVPVKKILLEGAH